MDRINQTTNFQASTPAVATDGAAPVSERLVTAKELMELFALNGVPIGYKYARAILARCPQTAQGRYVRFSDAWTWWTGTPGFKPFSGEAASTGMKKQQPRARGCIRGTRLKR